jgi:cbb3-type cytochrome oxidase maturation protein
MNIIPILIVASLALAGIALMAFIWAVRTGQFDDTFTPSIRILTDHREIPATKENQAQKKS